VIIGTFFLFLGIANQISILVAPCNQFSNAKSDQDKENNTPDNECAAKDGVILQGVSMLAKIPPEWLGAISSIFIAVFTLTLWIATDRLWRISLIHARHMERSVGTARATAGAAKQSADTSERALISTQRAFVFLQTFNVYVVGNEIRVMPLWENSGVTPANPFRNYVNWKPFKGPPPTDFAFPDLDPDGNPLPGRGQGDTFFIGPKATMFADIVRIPIDIMEEMRAGHLRMFIWGWAEYNDIFSGEKIHTSKFCREMVITDTTREGEKLTSVAAGFRVYGKYNSSD
jgi:hypothetical protein